MKAEQGAAPQQALNVFDAVAVVVGIVVGAGIFKTPAVVAANAGSAAALLLAWVLGGAVSLVGALCYAELATAYPHAGGEYHYLMRAFGEKLAFLFAWARLTVIQTGSIGILAFVFGDYAAQILPLGTYGGAIYAVLSIIVLTALHALSFNQGKRVQNALAVVKVLGLLLVFYAGFQINPTPAPTEAAREVNSESSAFGLAMIFVLLTYGGWNEAAYVSAELRDVRRNMARALIAGIAIITAVFILANVAYLNALGIEGIAASEVVAADLMRRAFGEGGAKFISALIAVSALGATSITIFTGARTNYALGQNFPLFSLLGRWHGGANSPVNALLAQSAIALLLVALGAWTRRGFETLVEYGAPVFWFFFLLTGLSLFVLRRREPHVARPFRVPLYPLTPLLFCATCAYMLWSSLNYTGVGALAGVTVLLAGLPFLYFNRFVDVRLPHDVEGRRG